MTEEFNLKKLEQDYLKIQKAYDLPSFDKMNEDFQIEKIESETVFLIREIRKFIADKFSNYFRFIETILNPVNVPMFIFSIIKSISTKEKEKLTEIYKKLAKVEVELIELDLKFSEKKEAEFVKHSYQIWQGIKEDFLTVIGVMKRNWDNKIEKDKEKYLG